MNQRQNEIQQEYIDKSVEFFQENNCGYLDLAMRFGKCRTAIEVLKRLYNYDCTVLIAYPDNKLKQTWMDEITLWKYDNPNITFVNFSSIKNYCRYIFDFIIIDEYHSASALEREYFLSMFIEGSKVLGLSGTVSKNTIFEWQLPLIAKYSTLDGIEEGILADYQITVHMVELDNKILVKDSKGKLLTEKQKYRNYSYVIENMKRNGKDFMFMALNRNRLSQASLGKLNYLKKLLSSLEDRRVLVFTGLAKAADQIGIPSYHSKSKSDLNFILFKEEKINQLALASMGKMGVTYPNLDCVILSNFTGNAEETSQILNRAIKLDYHNKVADLHILCLNEDPELKKIQQSLKMMDKNKIKYL